MLFREAEELSYQGAVIDDNTASCGKSVRLQNAGDYVSGPSVDVPGGIYSGYFALKVGANTSPNRICTLDIRLKDAVGTIRTVRSREIKPSDFETSGKWYLFGVHDLRVLDDDYDIELRVRDFVAGITTLDVDWVGMLPLTLAGAWRDEYKGQLYAEINRQIAANNYWLNYVDLPKDCVVTLRINFYCYDSGIQKIRLTYSLRDSKNLDMVSRVIDPRHDWSAGQTVVHTLRGWTGPSDGLYTPRIEWIIDNADSSPVNIDFLIFWSRSPVLNV